MVSILQSEFAPFKLLHSELDRGYEQVPPDVRERLRRAKDCLSQNNWMQAEINTLEAHDICELTANRVGLAFTQLYLAEIYHQVGELERAIELCEEAYHIFRRQPANVHRYYEAVAAYILATFYRSKPLGGELQSLPWYQKALQQFMAAKKYWAVQRNVKMFNICQQVCKQIEGDKTVIRTYGSEQPKFDIWRCDAMHHPFGNSDGTQGYITDNNLVLIDETIYYTHCGNLPEIDAKESHYYFALRVPEDQWAISESSVGDYVFLRQQWQIKIDRDEKKTGVVWIPETGWVDVDFKRGRDGQIKFYYRRPQIIGKFTPPGDPAGKMKGYVITLLKPWGLDFAGVMIPEVGPDSTLFIGKEYRLLVGLSEKDPASDRNSIKINITVHAPGIDVLPYWTQSKEFFKEEDEPNIVEFKLIPRKEDSKQQIEVEFYHQQHRLATNLLSVNVSK